eukprot:TRINITY_DN1230_c0_g1_i1.p1 TRINITY_DN1230_c0_g1~~TRINITY_DN1230_c0_g1_i1.p1  ORF type:complete len:275 (-),score=90.70 TRINITY_DN1230_c0_g1_i1:41-808(-)
MARTPFVGGNWKMNLNPSEATNLVRELIDGHIDFSKVEVAVIPSFLSLGAVAEALHNANSPIKLGAQNFYPKPNGAFTGEVSLDQLKAVGVTLVLVGHSERRHVIGESDQLINQKVLAALTAGFEVIFCIGETLEQREAGKTDEINQSQLEKGLANVTKEQMEKVTIAYEPVWAIGTGKNASPKDAQDAHVAVRKVLTTLFGEETAAKTRIQYGGSMKPSNAQELVQQPDVDGGLVGGASLKAAEFLPIVKATYQ